MVRCAANCDRLKALLTIRLLVLEVWGWVRIRMYVLVTFLYIVMNSGAGTPEE